ncbi:MAG: hypothetical protein K0R50_2822 [Eubacterium sp.]|nr:hypothetical protein [Eubacterium sp.]
MNKEFVKKMVKAEILRYEAIKEILPESLKNRVETLEKDAGVFIQELALEIVSENTLKSKGPGSTENKKSAKRVQVDFN